jgi:hypothetical protein
MFSLALVVMFIFLSLLFIGPASYLLSSFVWMPSLIKWLLAISCIFVGGWACFIPVPLFRILGLLNIGIGIKIILDSSKKKTDA